MNNALAMVNTEWPTQVQAKQLKCATSGSSLQGLSAELRALGSASIANDLDGAIAGYLTARLARDEVRTMTNAIIAASMFLKPAVRDLHVVRRSYPLVRTSAGRLYDRARDWFTLIRQTPMNSSIDFIVSFDTDHDMRRNYCDYICVTVFTDRSSWYPDKLSFYVSDLRSFTWSGKSIRNYRSWILHSLQKSVADAGPNRSNAGHQIAFNAEKSLNARITRRRYEEARCCGIAAVIETYTGRLDDTARLPKDLIRPFLGWLGQERNQWLNYENAVTNLSARPEVLHDTKDGLGEVHRLPYRYHQGKPLLYEDSCGVCEILPCFSCSP
ncbi:hypothetical protein CMEL01_16744 [Colletotrichum melonis]|uniref:Uncharacterized protein n=1 Tax=Colletotrichum melonis TaxID=1209925 RepID=A0AAI9U9V6_9PEZI|nr:hypothetical protein CMEL01_16744 [Colletotrichum melonis]